MQATDDRTAARRFGEGNFPSSLDRMNWLAALFGGAWAGIHGIWCWSFALVAFDVFVPVLSAKSWGLVPQSLDPRIALRIGVVMIVALASIVHGIFGLRANRLMWARAAAQASGETRTLTGGPRSLADFAGYQRGWMWMGVVLYGLPLTIMLLTSREQFPGWALLDTLAVAVGLLPLAGFWVYDRWRRLSRSVPG